MALESEDFNLTELKQLTDVDWKNNHHCRAVAAGLVQGVYKSERKRQESQGPKVQSSHWQHSHFRQKIVLTDNKDSSIYGVVYEFKHTNSIPLPECAPKFVIAFRGTFLKSGSAEQDVNLIIKLLTAELPKDNSRCKPALDAVKEVVKEDETAIIWLAGHSLGSAIAMLVGKSMAQKGKYLETFLFNPPFLRSFLSRNINSPRLENVICSTKKVIRSGISFVGGDHLWEKRHGQFNALSHWIPNLFVNKDDPLCSGYIDHFKNRKIEAEIRSIRSAFTAAFGKDRELPIHLLPQAYLTISENSSSCNFFEAHGIKQWWYQMSIGEGFADSSTKVSIGDTNLVGEP
ncbi:hypothetical protein PVL29_021686 [Vitis rotundifolia]|uniref:Fungal lipase-type domain-containing protein n=1 Tax=Vitis rotundifolia TaxID=103349 RepID=A0AA38Z018_VITRO|nr:hypothetical protein PVL29_021686 [Vitis rotundifolia]